MLQSHLLLCSHGFRDIIIMLYNVSVMLSSALSSRSWMYICGLIPRNFAELAEAVPIESSLCLILNLFIFLFQKQTSSIRELESKLRSHKNSAITSPVPKEEHDNLKRELTDQTKEIRILRRTVDEMDLRLETQKQTLAARDGSIKKLLEMLQSKGLAADKIEESQKELEKVRVEKIEDQKKLKQLQDSISTQEREITDLKEVSNHGLRPHPNSKLSKNFPKWCISFPIS